MNKWLIIFAILLTACTGTSEKSEECITIDLATVFDHQPQEVALKKWAKSIQFIPLQTNDSILIKYISRIIKHGESYWYSMITELLFSTWQENIYTISANKEEVRMSLVVYPD